MYDKLKAMAQIVLPGLGTLYFALAQIWGLPKPEEVVGTIVAVDAFLGVLLTLSTKVYDNSDAKYDGAIQITSTDSTQNFNLALKDDPEKLVNQEEALFKIDVDQNYNPGA